MISVVYEQLKALPEGLTEEILCGQLCTQARPTARHGRVACRFDRTLWRYCDDGVGGAGGGWGFIEPVGHCIRDIEVAVPDVAGWWRECMPRIPEDNRVEVVPDGVCKIRSGATASRDREIKLPLHAHYGVAYAWLVDPKCYTLEDHGLADR